VSKEDQNTLQDFIQRKDQIEAELNQIQNDLENSVTRMKDSFLENIIPTDRIRKKPFKSVGLAALAGFILGLKRVRKKKSGNADNNFEYEPGVTHLMFNEIKRIAAQKAAGIVVDVIDKKFSERFYSSDKDLNGKPDENQ
jgi:ElaB/YqjD/DUF883 family membrane-anchored ribosome-binding protein